MSATSRLSLGLTALVTLSLFGCSSVDRDSLTGGAARPSTADAVGDPGSGDSAGSGPTAGFAPGAGGAGGFALAATGVALVTCSELSAFNGSAADAKPALQGCVD